MAAEGWSGAAPPRGDAARGSGARLHRGGGLGLMARAAAHEPGPGAGGEQSEASASAVSFIPELCVHAGC